MKILFYGNSGWIGKMFGDYLVQNGTLFNTGNARIDILDAVEAEIKYYNPTHVISFTGRTSGIVEGKLVNSIDFLEYPGKLKENIRDNLQGPLNLMMLSDKYNFHYTYLGTGCIFNADDTESVKFSEQDNPNYFGSSYSVVKGYTDQFSKQFKNCLNLRIRFPVAKSPHPKNLINKLANYKSICSVPNSVTVLDDFFPVFESLIKSSKSGTYNCVNPGLMSHNEILNLYKRYVDPAVSWTNITISKQAEFLLSGRCNNYMDTTKIQTEFPEIKDVKTSVTNVIMGMATTKTTCGRALLANKN